MFETLKKYANSIITIGTAIGMIVGAIVWVPQTLMTKSEAEQIFNNHVERDNALDKRISYNYLEIQISLNELILKDYEKRMPELNHEEVRRYEALKAGLHRLQERREKAMLEGAAQ